MTLGTSISTRTVAFEGKITADRGTRINANVRVRTRVFCAGTPLEVDTGWHSMRGWGVREEANHRGQGAGALEVGVTEDTMKRVMYVIAGWATFAFTWRGEGKKESMNY